MPRTRKLMRKGVEVEVGSLCITFRGELCKVVGITEPRHPGSTGRVCIVDLNDPEERQREYYPSVIGAKFE